MKKEAIMKFSIVFILFMILLRLPSTLAQEKQIREDVVVINVEVPVRVMYKGKPVDNLKKKDFKIFENGKELSINGFHIVHKKISSQKIELDSERKQFYKPRFFVLVFSLVQYNHHLVKGLDFLFSKVLRETDKLLVLANNQLIVFENLKNKKEAKKKINYVIKKQGLIASTIFDLYKEKVKKDMSFSRFKKINGQHYDVYDYLSNYMRIWREYKTRFLTPDISKYYKFAKFLEKIKLEKWVISFYQFERFPRLAPNAISAMVDPIIARLRLDKDGESIAFVQILEKLERDLIITLNCELLFPTKEISKLFYKVNTTFHTIFIPTISESFNNRVATALENNLREITKRTGGTLLTTSNLEVGLEKIIEVEDVLYLLTYAPEDESSTGKLKIKVNNKKYKVLYDDNMRADYITRYLNKRKQKDKTIEIQDIKFFKKKLVFDLKNYTLNKIENNNSGKIGVQITIKDVNSNILYSKKRIVTPKKVTTNISVDFKWLNPGRYDLMLDVIDHLKGKAVFEYLKIEVK